MHRSLIVIFCLGIVASANAQFAADNASNAVYTAGLEYIQTDTPLGNQTGAIHGLNGGYGFNAWQRGGYGSTTNHGSTLITNLDVAFNMGSQQFGLRSAPDGFEGADARRRMLRDLEFGEAVSFSMMAGGGGAGAQNTHGDFGIELRGAPLSNPGRDMFGINGSNGQNWSINGNFTSVAVTPGQRLDVLIQDIGASQFGVTLTPFGGSSSHYVATSSSAGAKLRTLQFYCFETNGDFYVNNLEAVPEPATLVAMAVGAGFFALRRRKNA